jgi:hypothetical protein
MRTRSFGLVVLLAISGCVTVSKSVLNESFAAHPVAPDQVSVLMASLGDSIPSDCERVAFLHASGDLEWTDEGDIYNKLREEAGKLGANTVFVQNMDDAGTGEQVVSALFGTTSDRDSDAVALSCPPGDLPGDPLPPNR